MKTKKIEAVKPVYTDKFTCTINSTETEINYRTMLPFRDYAKLVSDVAYQVVNDETGYNPFVYGVALKRSIIEHYTDYVISDDIDEVYNSGVLCDIYDNLLVKIGGNSDYKNAVIDIDKMIEFKKNQLVHKSEFDNLCKTLSDALLRFEKKFGKSINPKAINSVIEKLGDIEITEKSFIDALIDKAPIK